MDIYLFTGYSRCDLINKFAEYGWNLKAVVVPNSEKYLNKMNDLIQMCIRKGIPVITTANLQNDKDLELSISGSVLYSSGYPLILEENLFSKFKYAVNCHPTLLPKYRGKYLEYILLNDESYSGTTIHHIDQGCDSGPIVIQEKYKVEINDNVQSLLKKSYATELKLLDQVLSNPDTLNYGTAQQEYKSSTYIKSRTPDDSEVSSSLTLVEAYKKSRAFNDDLYPGFFRYKGFKIVFKMHLISEQKSMYGSKED